MEAVQQKTVIMVQDGKSKTSRPSEEVTVQKCASKAVNEAVWCRRDVDQLPDSPRQRVPEGGYDGGLDFILVGQPVVRGALLAAAVMLRTIWTARYLLLFAQGTILEPSEAKAPWALFLDLIDGTLPFISRHDAFRSVVVVLLAIGTVGDSLIAALVSASVEESSA